MNNARVITKNVFFSILQVVVSGITLFVLYKYLLSYLGAEKFGIWSIVITSTSSLSIVNVGFAGSLVKYIAKYSAQGDRRKAQLLIETMLITLALTFGVLLILSYPIFKLFLNYLIDSKINLSESYKILPYCLISFWLLILSGIFSSSLEGLNKVYLKNIIFIVNSVVTLIVSIILVPSKGLLGLAYSYIIGNTISLIISWLLVIKEIPLNPIYSLKWNRKLFISTLNYSTSFQIISIFTLLNEPVTKSLLTKFGGLELTGLYEMASRLTLQLRAIIVQANQALVPVFANLFESNRTKLTSYYTISYSYVFNISVLIFFSLIASAPLISILWIGKYNSSFIYYTIILSIGWLINTLTVPAYFLNLGTGKLKWNLLSHILMGLANLILGLIFALNGETHQIVLGWVIALASCSALISIKYHKENKIPLKELFPINSRFFLYITIILTIVFHILSLYLLSFKNNFLMVYCILVFLFIEVISLWFFTNLKSQIRIILLNNSIKLK